MCSEGEAIVTQTPAFRHVGQARTRTITVPACFRKWGVAKLSIFLDVDRLLSPIESFRTSRIRAEPNSVHNIMAVQAQQKFRRDLVGTWCRGHRDCSAGAAVRCPAPVDHVFATMEQDHQRQRTDHGSRYTAVPLPRCHSLPQPITLCHSGAQPTATTKRDRPPCQRHQRL